MLRKLIISACITGLFSLFIVPNADSQTTPDLPRDHRVTPTLAGVSSQPLPDLSDLLITAAQLQVQPTQPVQFTEIALRPEPVAIHRLPTRLISVSPLPIRALVESEVTSLSVATATDAAILDSNGDAIATLPQSVSYAAQPTAAGIQIGDTQFPPLVQIAPTEDGVSYVNGRWYRGTLTLVNIDSELLVVNNVDLEQYLYSVVGAEMPASWNSEALRAQAIAARSYALAHIENPASDWYDIGSNESYQMYRGIESETDSTYAAVVDTDGQVLVQDGHTLTALYASTDEVSNDAHSGIGMSQVGAAELADSGVLYEAILAHYYPGGEIYRLTYS